VRGLPVLSVVVLIVLALSGAARADTPPATPTDLLTPVQCGSPSCSDTQSADPAQDITGAPRQTAPPGENERFADYGLLFLLASLLFIVPIIVLRQRNAREASEAPPAPRRPLRLAWSRRRPGV
jgi:hypothetical protein